MRLTCLTTLLITTLPLFAHAQSNVQLYGILDAGLAIEDQGTPGQGSRTVINSGNRSSTRLGIRASEDLGDDLKAIVNLEAGFGLDNGVGDDALFGRRAVVGLEGRYGELTIGREHSPIARLAAATDIFGHGFYGSNLSAFSSARVTRRLSNSVNYHSPSWAGFRVRAAWSDGENLDDPSGDLRGLGLEYTHGNLFLNIAHHEVFRSAIGEDNQFGLGVAYKMGALTFKGNYLSVNRAGPDNTFQQLNLGGSYRFGVNTVLMNLQRNALDKGGSGHAWSLAYTYALSKRTSIYTTYSAMNNDEEAMFGLNGSGVALTPLLAGADPTAFTVGLRHSF